MPKKLRFPVISRKRRRPLLDIKEVENIKTKMEVETSQENFSKKEEEKPMLLKSHVGPLFLFKKRRKKITVKEFLQKFFIVSIQISGRLCDPSHI